MQNAGGTHAESDPGIQFRGRKEFYEFWRKGTMRFPFFISFVLVRRLRSVYLVLFFPTLLYSQSATAPTVLQDPITIDMVWQKASGKYDSARAALLQEAERVDQEGPFRPD